MGFCGANLPQKGGRAIAIPIVVLKYRFIAKVFTASLFTSKIFGLRRLKLKTITFTVTRKEKTKIISACIKLLSIVTRKTKQNYCSDDVIWEEFLAWTSIIHIRL